MRIEDLKGRVNNEIIESLSARGIGELTPPQSAAIDNGLLDGRNIVVAAPTASGKTIVAEIACMVNILSGKKAVYIAPMRALVTEKYNEFVHDYPYIKTAISIGDMDSTDPWMAEYDMMFVSTEKFDSLIRHKIDWLGRVGCVIFDEVHMIGEVSRGPTLELVMT
ncbi:MAG: DEAD/DEAH box helicase, partial [Candidatus Marsarchaeota archaeon]|nr:DEAD/DEAH box helicase [Candidatus Marsarchaeota archaeon]